MKVFIEPFAVDMFKDAGIESDADPEMVALFVAVGVEQKEAETAAIGLGRLADWRLIGATYDGAIADVRLERVTEHTKVSGELYECTHHLQLPVEALKHMPAHMLAHWSEG